MAAFLFAAFVPAHFMAHSSVGQRPLQANVASVVVVVVVVVVRVASVVVVVVVVAVVVVAVVVAVVVVVVVVVVAVVVVVLVAVVVVVVVTGMLAWTSTEHSWSARFLLTKKGRISFRVGIFLGFVRRSGTTRTPHGAHVRVAEGNRIDTRWGEYERLAARTRRMYR